MNTSRPALIRLLAVIAALVLLVPLGLQPASTRAVGSISLPPRTSNLKPQTSYLAHPAPSVIHDFVITLHKDAAEVWARFMVSPPLVPQLFGTIDTDGDGTAAPAEQQRWIADYAGKLQ